MHLEVPRVDFEKLQNISLSESSAQIRERVQEARDIQTNRFADEKIMSNSEMALEQINKYCVLDNVGSQLLRQAAEKLHLSARAYFRILKLARTIADLEKSENILSQHVAEALQYRPSLEMK